MDRRSAADGRLPRRRLLGRRRLGARKRPPPRVAAGEARDALRAGQQIARRIGSSRLADRIEALARRRRIELAGEKPAEPSGDLEPVGDRTSALQADPFGLTAREREILRLLADGYSNRRIAEALFISESTAGVHVSNILGKLGVASRTEAATTAVRLGLDRLASDGVEAQESPPTLR